MIWSPKIPRLAGLTAISEGKACWVYLPWCLWNKKVRKEVILRNRRITARGIG